MFKKLLAVVLAISLSPLAAADLVDGSFESADPWAYAFFQGGYDTPWQTTAPDNLIEIWNGNNMGVTPYHGNNFAELNANYASTLYQDVNGLGDYQSINWKFAHRGRDGIDTMRLTITDLGWDQMYGGGNDTILFQGEFSDSNTAWILHTGTIISIGNPTRFAFEAVSATGGNTQGNFIDDCGFGANVVIPAPGSAALICVSVLCSYNHRRRLTLS
jgi:hypothetical protein